MKQCKVCNAPLLKRKDSGQANKIFCSRKCRDSFNDERKKTICKQCGLSFSVKRTCQIGNFTICSVECRKLFQKINSPLVKNVDKYKYNNLGKKHKEVTLVKMSLKRKEYWIKWREQNGLHGPISKLKNKLYSKIRSCLSYKLWRQSILIRDNFSCISCGVRSMAGSNVKLEVDHIKGFADIIIGNHIQTFEEAERCQELWDINNGRVLCLSCHMKTPNYFSWWVGQSYKAIKSSNI